MYYCRREASLATELRKAEDETQAALRKLDTSQLAQLCDELAERHLALEDAEAVVMLKEKVGLLASVATSTEAAHPAEPVAFARVSTGTRLLMVHAHSAIPNYTRLHANAHS